MKYIQEENRFEEEIIKPAKPIKPLTKLKKVEGEVKTLKKEEKKEEEKSVAELLKEMQKVQTDFFTSMNEMFKDFHLDKLKVEQPKPEDLVELERGEIIKPEEEKK